MKREGKKRAREISRNDVKEKEYLFHFSGTSENVVKALLDLDMEMVHCSHHCGSSCITV